MNVHVELILYNNKTTPRLAILIMLFKFDVKKQQWEHFKNLALIKINK